MAQLIIGLVIGALIGYLVGYQQGARSVITDLKLLPQALRNSAKQGNTLDNLAKSIEVEAKRHGYQ